MEKLEKLTITENTHNALGEKRIKDIKKNFINLSPMQFLRKRPKCKK